MPKGESEGYGNECGGSGNVKSTKRNEGDFARSAQDSRRQATHNGKWRLGRLKRAREYARGVRRELCEKEVIKL